ncbi:MAG: hypothetical protein AAFV53_20915 [Myxococcota bacterium]
MLLALSVWLGVAHAEDAEETSGSSATLDVDFTSAEMLGDTKARKLKWLKPKRHWLPQNPYAHTDFSAYTLETGEVEVGLMNIRAGILPNIQVGTAPLLNVAGVYNGSLKLQAIHGERIDLSGQATHYRHTGGLQGQYTVAGLTTSVRILEPWSIHLTGSYLSARVSGLPDVDGLIGQAVSQYTGYDLQAWRDEAVAQGLALSLDAEAVTAKVATDIRLNRRDSLIIQAQAVLWGSADAQAAAGELDLPPVLGIPDTVDFDEAGMVPLSQAYMASASWQWSWKRAYLRVGAGVSSVQGAWFVQSTELAWRFGGETRRHERQLRTAWRKNKRKLRRGADATQSSGQADATVPDSAQPL